MIKINPYLTLPGTAAQAIELYRQVFKVEPTNVQKYKDMPRHEGMPALTAKGGERIVHAGFQIGNDTLMISDAPEGQDNTVIKGSQTHVSVHPDSKKEADRIFSLLAEGGSVYMQMEMQYWGDYFGMCSDKFGIHWMINYHEEQE